MPIKFCSETYFFFQAWGSLTSLKSQTRDPQLKLPPGGLVLRIFTSWKKNPSTLVRFEPANLGSRGEHVTPSSPRPTIITYLDILIYNHAWKNKMPDNMLNCSQKQWQREKDSSAGGCIWVYSVSIRPLYVFQVHVNSPPSLIYSWGRGGSL